MKKICLIGNGGHGKVVKDIVHSSNQYKIAAVLDDQYKRIEKKGMVIYGPISLALNLAANDDMCFAFAIGDNLIRKEIAEDLGLPENRYATLKHPSAIISPSATIGYGTVIMPRAVINADSKIGCHTIINTGAIVEHDNLIGDFAHISPGAVLAGAVQVGEGAQVCAGASVIPNITIGSWSLIGAGSAVIKNVHDQQKVAGTPAKELNP